MSGKVKYIIAIILTVFTIKGLANDISMTLDEYLKSLGVTEEQNAGHVNLSPEYDPKARYFVELLQKNPHVKNITEIGFCLGHSSEVFLSVRPDTKVVSFDMMYHWQNYAGKQYIDMKHPGRHQLIEGDSLIQVPLFIQDNKGMVFDLILIDGGHEYHVALNDLINMQYLADQNTILIMDDTDFEPVARAWCECVANGLVEEIEKRSDCGLGWTLGRYYGKANPLKKNGLYR